MEAVTQKYSKLDHQYKNVGVPDVLATSVSMFTIDQIDFGAIKFKLMTQEEGWSVEQVNLAEKWYKRFLFLCLKYPTVPTVPNRTIDKFWHHHILDTKKYAEDCKNIFGYFLHHFPYFGMRGDEDYVKLKAAFAYTNKLLLLEFDESLCVFRNAFGAEDDSSAGCTVDCDGGVCGDCSGGINFIDQSRPGFAH